MSYAMVHCMCVGVKSVNWWVLVRVTYLLKMAKNDLWEPFQANRQRELKLYYGTF